MDIQKKGNEIIIRHILKKNEMYKLSKGSTFESVSFYKTPQVCWGYSSKTENNKHILLLDYDDVAKEVVFDDIKHLQEVFDLPPAYLFTTGEKDENKEYFGNYHVVFLSVHLISEIFEMMGHTSIDVNFRTSPLRKKSRSWVLRIGKKIGSNKPKFLEIVGEDNLTREISTAHKKLLSKFFRIKPPKYLNEDKNLQIKMQKYETSR